MQTIDYLEYAKYQGSAFDRLETQKYFFCKDFANQLFVSKSLLLANFVVEIWESHFLHFEKTDTQLQYAGVT